MLVTAMSQDTSGRRGGATAYILSSAAIMDRISLLDPSSTAIGATLAQERGR